MSEANAIEVIRWESVVSLILSTLCRSFSPSGSVRTYKSYPRPWQNNRDLTRERNIRAQSLWTTEGCRRYAKLFLLSVSLFFFLSFCFFFFFVAFHHDSRETREIPTGFYRQARYLTYSTVPGGYKCDRVIPRGDIFIFLFI